MQQNDLEEGGNSHKKKNTMIKIIKMNSAKVLDLSLAKLTRATRPNPPTPRVAITSSLSRVKSSNSAREK